MFAISVLLFVIATSLGVFLVVDSLFLLSAPQLSKSWTTSWLPNFAAVWRTVQSSCGGARAWLTLAPFWSNNSSVLIVKYTVNCGW